jgi:hypothetical protein
VRPAVKVHVQVPVSVPVSVPLKRGAFACLDEEICEDACEENVSPTGVEACIAEGCVAEELDFDKETIIWGVGLKSMIGKEYLIIMNNED